MKKSLRKLGIIFTLTAGLSLCACSGNTETVAVQSVAEITGMGNIGMNERFAAVVCEKGKEEVKADSNKKVLEILVKEGDEVKAGQPLFTYDVSLAQLNLEKAELELTQLKSTLADAQSEKASLEKQREEANDASQFELSLAIQRCDTNIREAEYNINLKQKEVDKLAESVDVTECTAPIDGRVKSISNPENEYSQTEAVTVVITEAGAYRIKGYVNENNASSIYDGMEVCVYSRVTDETWSGSISEIDWENPVAATGNNNYYQGQSQSEDTNLTGTNKYPFYIELADSQGLLLGQHVYVEGASSEEEIVNAIQLSSAFVFDMDESSGYVWAEGKNSKLEKRKIEFSAGSIEGILSVTSGLDENDYIAFPAEDMKAGMKCKHYDATAEGEMPPVDDGSMNEGAGGSVEEGVYPDMAR